MHCFQFSKICLVFFLFCAATVVSSPAQTFSVITTFNVTNGALPEGALVQGLDGNFYGVTQQGGRCGGGCGTIFKISPSGTLTTLHEFVGTDGFHPIGGLLLAADGNFYGTTTGSNGTFPNPRFFELASGGTFSVISDISITSAPLIQDTTNGLFYGTVPAGSFSSDPGLIFSLSSTGTFTTIHTFCELNTCGGPINGYNPQAPLLEDVRNGLFYGTAYFGGTENPNNACKPGFGGCGTIFVIGTGGTLKSLHDFNSTDGANPAAGLVQGADGNFYGTTQGGGLATGQRGTAFRMTPTGTLTTLYNFCSFPNCTDGFNPQAALIQATDGNFYGTTKFGGVGSSNPGCKFGCGTVFQLTPSGTLTTLHSFEETDGMEPLSALVQGTDGNLYGVATSIQGMSFIPGTVFKISMGLAPFVKTLPLASRKGTQIFILGTDLTGATSVTFNGTSAAFTVVGATEITATVPAGGTSGLVQVVTPGGTLSSNVPFRVY